MKALLATVPKGVLLHVAGIVDSALPTVLVSVCDPTGTTTVVSKKDLDGALEGCTPHTRDNSIHYSNKDNMPIISELFPHPPGHKHPWDRFSQFPEHLSALVNRATATFPTVSNDTVSCDIARGVKRLLDALEANTAAQRGCIEVVIWGPSLYACYYRRVTVTQEAVDLFLVPAGSDVGAMLAAAGCDPVRTRVLHCEPPSSSDARGNSCSLLSDAGSVVLVTDRDRLVMNTEQHRSDIITLSSLAAAAKGKHMETIDHAITATDIVGAKAVGVVSAAYGGSLLVPVKRVMAIASVLEKEALPSLSSTADKQFGWISKDSSSLPSIAEYMNLILDMGAQPVILSRYDGSYVPPPEDDDEEPVYDDDEDCSGDP